MWVMELVEGTESRGYSGIKGELFGLWSGLKVQRAGGIVVYRVNCVGLYSELKVQRAGCIVVYRVNCVGYGTS